MLLETRAIEAGYGKLKVLHGVSLRLAAGEILAVIGHNGAGKSTLPKALLGLVRIGAGQVLFEDKDVTNRSPAEQVRAGMYLLPQGRGVFPGLSVEENLRLGAHAAGGGDAAALDRVFGLFPTLRERRRQLAGSMSGGEQRLVSLGMAMTTRPKLLFVDEPSIGLAPLRVQEVMAQLRRISRELGTAILLIEQNVRPALEVADRACVLRLGRMALEDRAARLLEAEDYWDLF
jgi:branched-chain amino acid transport system ATP-binding protein